MTLTIAVTAAVQKLDVFLYKIVSIYLFLYYRLVKCS